MDLLFKCTFGLAIMATTIFLCSTLSSYIPEGNEQQCKVHVRPSKSPVLVQTMETEGSVTMVQASNDRAGDYCDLLHDGLTAARKHTHRTKLREIERNEMLQKQTRDLKTQKNIHDIRTDVLQGQHETEKAHLKALHDTEIEALQTLRRMAWRRLSSSSSSSSDSY